jgi:hypothetical protein
VHSISEVRFEEGRLPGAPPTLPDGTPFPRGYFRLVTGEGRTAESTNLDPTTTTVVRLWTADAEWSAEPDSPMRSLVGVCERLLLIERGDDAALRSRAAGNGVLLWPEELDAIPHDEDEEEDEFDRDFVTQLTTPLTLDGSAAQVVPMIKRGAYQYLDRIRHLTFGRPLDPLTSERESRLLARLGIGLDVPPEVITGLADTNHWNAWQITSDLFRHHQEPITIASVEGLSLGYLRARLTAARQWDDALIRRLVIWYDASDLIAPADMSAAANDAHDRGLITDSGYRALRGIGEEYAPADEQPAGTDPVGTTGLSPERLAAVATIAETLLRAGYKPDAVSEQLGLPIEHSGLMPVNFRSEAALEQAGIPGTPGDTPEGRPADYLPPGTGPDPAAPPPDAPPPPPAPPPPAEAPPPASAATRPQPTDTSRRLSRRLAQIDRTLRERIATAADAALARALERAGNRARAAAQRDPEAREAVAGQPPEGVLASLGQAVVAALGLEEQQLLAEAFGRLREQYTEWTSNAAEEAIDAAAQITGLDRSDPDVQRHVAELRDRFAENTEASWPVLESGLNDLAADALYSPDPAAPEVGEVAAGRVPPGLVRQALAIAGGLAADHPGTAGPGRPLSGLTSGALLDGFLRDAGAEVAEYEWAYGISARPFPPHAALDGLVFAGFDDDALSTSHHPSGAWVGESFAPGDHKGCHCDYVPIYTDGRDTRAEQERISRAAHAEQYPDRPIPTRQATNDPDVYRPQRITRPQQTRSPEAQTAYEARIAPPPPVIPVPARRQTARGRRVQPAVDEAGIPMQLSHDYLSRLSEEQLDDLAEHLAVRLDDANPVEGRRWSDLEAFLDYRQADERLATELSERFASDDEWQAAYGDLERTLGRPGVTHPRVGGHDMRTTPTRREVQEEYDLFVEQQFLLAEQAVKTSDVNAAGAARGIGLRDLLTGDVRDVYRYASPELLEWFETNRRITWTEFYYARTGSPAFAERAAKHAEQNARINRDRTDRPRGRRP